MKNETLDTSPKPVRRAFRNVLAQHGMVHSLKKTPCNGVSIYEMVSSDTDGEWFDFSTIYVRDTGNTGRHISASVLMSLSALPTSRETSRR